MSRTRAGSLAMRVRSLAERAEEWVDAHPRARILRQTVKEFVSDDAPVYAAALAFFALFALGALVVLVITSAGVVFGEDTAARERLLHVAESVLGEDRAPAVESVIMNARLPDGSPLGTAVALALLAFAASRVIVYLARSLNRIWDMAPRKDRSLARTARKRVLSLVTVLAVTFLLFLSLVGVSVLDAVARAVRDAVPVPPVAFTAAKVVVAFAVLTSVFGVLYKYLPDARISWRDVGVGAVGTTLLFLAGQAVIARALEGSDLTRAFGGFAALAAVLLWFYYTSLVFILGAEFTQVYAREHGHPIRPERDLAEPGGRKRARRARTRA